MNSLKNTTIVMVASARPEDIRSFAQERNLDGFENIKFAIGNPVDVFSVYGQITVPHLVLYSKNHGKIREFSGVTQVSEFKRFLE